MSFHPLPTGVEEQYFKRVPDGWVFAAARPWWLFGRRPTFLVTDAQKPAIAARLRLNRYLRNSMDRRRDRAGPVGAVLGAPIRDSR